MRFREEQSSSVELGFRIEAMHVAEKDEISNSTFSKYFVPKDEAGVTGEIKRFIHGTVHQFYFLHSVCFEDAV
jgi:hypothetical protein